MLAKNKGDLAHSYLKAVPASSGRFITYNPPILMKSLATLAIIASIFGLSSCSTCPFAPKKECCKAGTSACCDSKKTSDCKTCKR